MFVDETGTNIAMTRRYARAPRGRRAQGKVPRNYGKQLSLVAALSSDGLGEAMVLEGAMDGAAFIVYVEKLLCPSLRAGQVVVMDNLSVHKSVAVRELIEAAGCSLVYLPAYSPDFSPIEMAFSTIKEALRAAGARSRETLGEAITAAIEMVTASDAAAYFRHCGYHVYSN